MIIYSQFTKNRKEKFKLITGFEIKGNSKKVYKEPVTLASEEFADSLISKYQELKKYELPFKIVEPEKLNNKIYFDFINGDTLAYLVENYIRKGEEDKAVEEVFNYINLITSLAQETEVDISKSKLFFGEGIGICKKWIGCGLVDLDLGNIIKNKEGYYLIDYEWTFDFPIPLEYVLFRALNDLVVHKLGGKNLVSQKLYEIYKSYIKDELIEAEFNFQSYVVENQKNSLETLTEAYKSFRSIEYKARNYINDKKELVNQLQSEIENKANELNHLNMELQNLKRRRTVKVALIISKLVNKLRRIVK